MSSNSPNRTSHPYHLRPRSKVVRPNSPAILHKTCITRQELSMMKRKIAEGVKLRFDEIEAPGHLFRTVTGEPILTWVKAKLKASGLVYKPPTPISDEERARMIEQQHLKIAEIGLSCLNDPANGDAKYQLVRPVASAFFLSDRGGVYHCNFEAKLKNDPEAEIQLFFLEVVEKVPGKQKITHCRSLGLCGSKAAATGLNGCTACSKINHPKKVRFVTC